MPYFQRVDAFFEIVVAILAVFVGVVIHHRHFELHSVGNVAHHDAVSACCGNHHSRYVVETRIGPVCAKARIVVRRIAVCFIFGNTVLGPVRTVCKPRGNTAQKRIGDMRKAFGGDARQKLRATVIGEYFQRVFEGGRAIEFYLGGTQQQSRCGSGFTSVRAFDFEYYGSGRYDTVFRKTNRVRRILHAEIVRADECFDSGSGGAVYIHFTELSVRSSGIVHHVIDPRRFGQGEANLGRRIGTRARSLPCSGKVRIIDI